MTNLDMTRHIRIAATLLSLALWSGAVFHLAHSSGYRSGHDDGVLLMVFGGR